jgi:putative tricarboxylic transport membrane protein
MFGHAVNPYAPMVKPFDPVLSVPPWILLPGIAIVSFGDIHSLSERSVDLILMIVFGLFEYLYWVQ